MPNNVVESLDFPDGAAYIVLKPTDGGFKAMLFDLLKDENKDLGAIIRGIMELVGSNTTLVLLSTIDAEHFLKLVQRGR